MEPDHTHNKGQENNLATDHHEKLSFHEIYDAISKQTRFTRDELIFLRRIIQRMLRDVTQHLNKETMIFRPYSDLFYM